MQVVAVLGKVNRLVLIVGSKRGSIMLRTRSQVVAIGIDKQLMVVVMVGNQPLST